MGQIKLPESGNVYLDANCFIYSIEGVEPYYTILRPLWRAVGDKKFTIVTSEITLLEVLVKPLKIGDFDVANDFRGILHQLPEVQMMPITQTILEDAARLRATTSLKTPDAIHAATASRHKYVLFMTNDITFRQIKGLPVSLLNEISIQEDINTSASN